MKAMIFAAGLGTRLYPLTKDKPKALVSFGDKTLLEHNLKFLASQGIESFIINTHHFADRINEYLYDNEYFGLDITISYEEELLETGGGLAKVREMIDKEQILLYNVDIISNIDINKMHKYHMDNRADITLATRDRITSRYLIFDNGNKMIGWTNEKTGEIKSCSDKPEFNKLAFSGVSILNTDILVKLGDIDKKSIIDFFLDICADHKIFAYQHNQDHWYDCGSLEKLKIAENRMLKAK